MNVTETYNTRNAGMKQELVGMKNEFIKSLDDLKSDTRSKVSNINNQLI